MNTFLVTLHDEDGQWLILVEDFNISNEKELLEEIKEMFGVKHCQVLTRNKERAQTIFLVKSGQISHESGFNRMIYDLE